MRRFLVLLAVAVVTAVAVLVLTSLDTGGGTEVRAGTGVELGPNASYVRGQTLSVQLRPRRAGDAVGLQIALPELPDDSRLESAVADLGCVRLESTTIGPVGTREDFFPLRAEVPEACVSDGQRRRTVQSLQIRLEGEAAQRTIELDFPIELVVPRG